MSTVNSNFVKILVTLLQCLFTKKNGYQGKLRFCTPHYDCIILRNDASIFL